MFDIIISGGIVVDGDGAPGVRQDVGIRRERIAAIGDLSAAEAARRIDATGRVALEKDRPAETGYGRVIRRGKG